MNHTFDLIDALEQIKDNGRYSTILGNGLNGKKEILGLYLSENGLFLFGIGR